MVVVADAGMLSASNLKELDDAGLRFIVGSRVTKAPIDLASHFRWHGGLARRAASRLVAGGVGLLDQRAARDNKTLTLQENRAKEVVAGEKTARTPRLVKNSNGTKTLDEASLARARRLVGLKGYITNIPVDLMGAGEVIASYHDLWRIEQSFRMSKTDLRARPMFVRTRDATEAHLTTVFTALALSREVQERTGLAIRNLVRQLRPLRSATTPSNGTEQTLPPVIPDEQQALPDTIINRNLRH